MSKHTPGPWQKNGMVIAGADGTEVCLMGEPAQYAGDIGKMCQNADANARLIEAAPDLLEAAKDALSGWRYIRDQHGDLHGVGWDRVGNALSAAIAKAGGWS